MHPDLPQTASHAGAATTNHTLPTHVKLDPQPAWARFEEVIVRLDRGELVAVTSENSADLRGGTAIVTSARVVDASGKPRHNAAGLPIATNLWHPYDAAELGADLRIVDVQRDCVRVVLGEPTVHLFTDAAGRQLRAKLSIRNKLPAVAVAAPSDAPATS